MSLGSATWLKPMPLYALGPLEGLRIRRLIGKVERHAVPARAPQPIDFAARPIEAEPFETQVAQAPAGAPSEPELVASARS